MLARPCNQQDARGGRSHGQTTNQGNGNNHYPDRPAETQDRDEFPYFGNLVGPRPWNVFRGLGVNVNGLPVSVDDEKNEHFFTALRQYQVNGLMVQEVNANEGKLGRRHKIRKRIRTQLGPSAKLVHAYNLNDNTGDKQQYGGTAIISTGDSAHFAMGAGVDDNASG